jgi:dihydropteroate synthase
MPCFFAIWCRARKRVDDSVAALLATGRTLVMGVLNMTPDSFSGDGLLARPRDVVRTIDQLMAEGADIIDIGGESTRPGADPVDVAEERRRMLPAVRAAVVAGAVVSIDTRKAEVASAARDAGACIVNDVSGLHDPEMASIAAQAGAWLVLMHNGGVDATDDPLPEIAADLAELASSAEAQGVPREKLIVDPGLGFGKTWRTNLRVVRDLQALGATGLPVLVGPSRKATISRILGVAPDDRLEGTLALVATCITNGARLVRVHDVREAVRAVRMTDALMRARGGRA